MARSLVLLRAPGDRGWRAFSDPQQILAARTPADVLPCLRHVQRAVDSTGCWAAGFVAYEAAAAFGLPTMAEPRGAMPLVWFALYPHRNISRRESLDDERGYRAGPWRASIDKARYLRAIAAIKARIAAGDTYQINYTFRLQASFEGEPLALLRDLDRAQRGPWGAFVDTGTHAICSASPELFFLLERGRITCRPMKGTVSRGRWAGEDRQRALALQRSPKNRAENVMVVDMTRNDVGRIARTGTVAVRSLFDVERYPGQWQMTSTVRAEVDRPGLIGLFDALFPSGSVTGAPKRSSMAIIRDLESGPRGVYTGAIGCVSPEGFAQFNVAIRTVTVDRERREAEFGVGSGVVWDSVDRDEYDECFNKAAMLTVAEEPFRLLETLRWSPSEGFTHLELHLARMRASAAYFGFGWPGVQAIRAETVQALRDRQRDARVRILLDADGGIDVQPHDLAPLPVPLRVALAAEAVSSADVFLFHKTTRRSTYDRARASRPHADSALLWNERGEITEGTDANVVVETGGRRVTPPLECGLLPGILRAELLRTGQVEEAIVRREDLSRLTRIWLISSARGWMQAEIVNL